MEILTIIFVVLVFVGVMFVANIADQKRAPRRAQAFGSPAGAYPAPAEPSSYDPDEQRANWARQVTPWLLLGLNVLALCNGFAFLVLASMPSALLEGATEAGLSPAPSPAQASGAMFISVLMAVGASVLLIPQVRQAIARGQILNPAFDPASAMHMVALVFCVYLLGQTGLQFALVSDPSELADAVTETPVLGMLALQTLIFYVIAAVGVGFPQRRTWREARARLGLVRPTWPQVGIAVGAGLVMMAFEILVLAIWMIVAGEESVAAQMEAAGALSQGFDNLIVAFVVAFLTATSEETAFRGALQPVVGIGITSIVFAFSHIQYGLTPATLVVLALAVVLGFLRARLNTTSAIVTHFTYNFVSLAVSVLFQQLLEGLP